MFRRKKHLGTVTVFEEDEPVPADNFDDLGLNDIKHKDSTNQDLNQMTAAQLESLALGTAQTGREGTQRALRMALEAREIGVSTAETMKSQTAQLEKMSEDIEVVHDYLDKSERLIDKMTKPKLVRMFQRKKGNGKGLDKVKISKKEREDREQLRDKGLDAVQLDDMSDSQKTLTLDDIDDQRDQLFDGETVTDYKRSRRGKKKEPQIKETRQIREDYSQYAAPVASVMRQQDDDLDQISDALVDMKALASAMNNELDYQDKLITEVQDFTQETARRTKDNAQKIKRIK
ncbi:hypothetical protein BWQ96_08681 [Gracilariopsis chorda]|uniref:t-SNARE coiled-coil homology domain-containing protein n=1 Tax=Gracilariopsis chorda TaxID=448386 RepID=A0A2V3IHM2_9FLOR|nr:hypothetical protein BWQ96_08681 [Gracilariopsis chorda]|eukprot:PXF41594.1 hypothetical protein BWQ96_08681 [Gracilariopsis chorda]